MPNNLHPSKPFSQTKNKRFMMVFLLPLASCLVSSVVGVFLGQMGNIFYKMMGDAANCLAIPGFCGLFLVTFGISFFANRLLKKWLFRPAR